MKVLSGEEDKKYEMN